MWLTLTMWLQVTSHVPGADKAQVLHVTVTEEDMHRLGLEQIMIGLPYATHLLDNRTGHRIDKRGLLPVSGVSVRSVFAALVADEDVHHHGSFPPPAWGPQSGFPELSAGEPLAWGGIGRLEGVVGLSEAQGLSRHGGDVLLPVGREESAPGATLQQEWRAGGPGQLGDNSGQHALPYGHRLGSA